MRERRLIQGQTGSGFRAWRVAAFLFVTAAVSSSMAFPSWMGVYGPYLRHDGGNPGTFTILMNQDYWGLNADVGIHVSGGGWNTYPMTYWGNVDGNSVWKYWPASSFPGGQTVTFYFHGWDNWGGHIWDSNYGANYSFVAHHNGIVQWVGNTSHFPANGNIEPTDDLWIDTQTWPAGAAEKVFVQYSVNGGKTWIREEMSTNGQGGNNDAWHLNLGPQLPGITVAYVINVYDYSGNEDIWDNNGLQNYAAVVSYDPAADSDGDGLPNWWEMQYGFDINDPTDALMDVTGDGLNNLMAYLHGTDPWKIDTDGDGVPDAVEIYGTNTDPAVPDAPAPLQVASIDVLNPSLSEGSWWDYNGAIVLSDLNGSLVYQLTLPESGVYLLKLEGGQHLGHAGINHEFPIEVSVNGASVGRVVLQSSGGGDATGRIVLPYLGAGPHELMLKWRNVIRYWPFGADDEANRRRLRLTGAVVESIPGPLKQGHNPLGLKQWEYYWLANRNGVTAPASSFVSPVDVEGVAAHLDYVEILHPQGIAVQRGISGAWFASVPLTEVGVTDVGVSFENGALTHTVYIDWQSYNVFTMPDITVRAGDSMLLTGVAPELLNDGEVSIWINGTLIDETDVYSPVPYEFTVPGVYEVVAIHNDGQASQIGSNQVTAVDSSFNLSLASWVGHIRQVDFSYLPEQAHLYFDSSIRRIATGDNEYGIWLDYKTQQCAPIIIRLGPNGPVLGKIAVDVFEFGLTSDNGLLLEESFADGSLQFLTEFNASDIREDVNVVISIHAPGVTFTDGTTEKTLTAADYDEHGSVPLRMLLPPGANTSTCHEILVLHAGEPLQGGGYVHGD